MIFRFIFLTLILSLLALPIKVFSKTITFGITNVAVKDDYYTIKLWQEYLEKKSGFRINLKITKSYDEMQYFIENKTVDIAYVCGATYVFLKKDKANVNLLVLPYKEGKPLYYSYIIVPRDSKVNSLKELKGKRFAYSDPKSNSGAIAPSYYLYKLGFNYKDFFSEIIYTYSHAESIKAVEYGFVDGAAVDSLVYDSMKMIDPTVVNKVKIIEKLGPFPTTPIIVNDTLTKEEIEKLRNAFLDMRRDFTGKSILKKLGIDYFEFSERIDYSIIEHMIDVLKTINP